MAAELGLRCWWLLNFTLTSSSNDNHSKIICCNFLYNKWLLKGLTFAKPFTDHGNHTEDSPFLGGADAAGKKNEFYDRNLALFEVCLIFLFF